MEITKLIRKLEKTELISDLELTDEDIADVIWLATQMGAISTSPKPQRKSPKKREKKREQWTNPRNIIDIDDKPITPVYVKESFKQTEEQNTDSKGLPFQVPAEPALQNTLPIMRALRPLMRKAGSNIRRRLDIEATVNQIAEQDLWLPILKPESERWLNLEIVFEESASSFIWQKTIEELQTLFEYHGAFRNVRQWSLVSDNNQPKLIKRRPLAQKTKGCSYRELLCPDGRGLILVITDCTSPLWYEAKIHPWLKEWSNIQPTAIVQLFPESMWQDTALSKGRKTQVGTISAGIPNSHLIIKDIPKWALPDSQDRLILPIIMPVASSLQNWANVVAGSSLTQTPAILLDLNFIKRSIDKNPSAIAPADISPEMRVHHFLGTASFTAQRLAGMMASVPVNLDVVNLIRKTLLPEADSVHVAEVYMGGLLKRVTSQNSQQTQYDFIEGVRAVLNREMEIEQTEAVLDAISAHIAEKLGLSLRSFVALLAFLPRYNATIQNQIFPFAKIAVEVLRNLGGEYAAFAEEVAVNIASPDRPSTPEVEKPFEPSLKTCTFDVATIEILETHTFKFTIATLQRQSGTSKGKQAKWVINRQQSQAEGIIEVIGEGIELELMEIPAGTFWMGAPEGELESQDRERPQHKVTVPSFYMGRYQVTQAQWKAIAERTNLKINIDLDPDPSRFKEDPPQLPLEKGENISPPPSEGGARGGSPTRWDRPVEQVNWYQAKEFCDRLSKLTEQQYRLPTEAEWEYACRSVISYQLSVISEELTLAEWNEKYNQPFHFGETLSTELANYDGNYTYQDGVKGIYREQTTPVGYFKVANAFGLFDMHGLVYEWCEDDYHDNYQGAPVNGSAWLSNDNSTTKILRGGSWIYNPYRCRSAYRDSKYPRDYSYIVGFRVVRSSPRTP